MIGRIGYVIGNILSWGWLAKFVFGIGDEISPASKPVIHLRMIRGKCCIITGRVPTRIFEPIEEIFITAAGGKGYVKLRKDGRFRFSRNVPVGVQQRIRNILSIR